MCRYVYIQPMGPLLLHAFFIFFHALLCCQSSSDCDRSQHRYALGVSQKCAFDKGVRAGIPLHNTPPTSHQEGQSKHFVGDSQMQRLPRKTSESHEFMGL